MRRITEPFSGNTVVATFHEAGNYFLRATVRDSDDGIAESDISITVVQTPTDITVSPLDVELEIRQNVQFSATVRDQFGDNISNANLNWTVNDGGSISTTGLFRAGDEVGGPFEIQVSMDDLVASTSVTIVASRPDSDQDGMSDEWEILFNLNKDDPSDAAGNPDGDNLTNLQEFLAGTSPHEFDEGEVIDLFRGWNLVSIARTSTPKTVQDIFGDTFVGRVWEWDPRQQAFSLSHQLDCLRGVWLYSSIRTVVRYTLE